MHDTTGLVREALQRWPGITFLLELFEDTLPPAPTDLDDIEHCVLRQLGTFYGGPVPKKIWQCALGLEHVRAIAKVLITKLGDRCDIQFDDHGPTLARADTGLLALRTSSVAVLLPLRLAVVAPAGGAGPARIHPLTSLQAIVLGALIDADGTPRTAEELARRCGNGHTAICKAVTDLCRQLGPDVVRRDRDGRHRLAGSERPLQVRSAT